MKTYIETSIAACIARGSDHHWDVLVRQATLTGMLNLFVCFAMVVLLGVLTRFVRTKTTSPKDAKMHISPEWDEDKAILAWVFVATSWFLLLLVTTLSLSDSITMITNPEYWALKQLL